MPNFHLTTLDFVSAIGQKFEDARLAKIEAGDKYAQHARTYVFVVESGKKFDKIVQSHGEGGQQGVHAFVEIATGKLIKAATWSAPQKDKSGLAYRFDLSTPEGFAEAVAAADPFGSYLYKR